MKVSKSIFLLFILMVVIGSVCRFLGFAPQIAMAVFGAVVISDKKWAIALPLLSMFLSDILFEVLYHYGLADYGGFYVGQITNYILFALITIFSFWVRGKNWLNITAAVIAAPVIYFLLSNFMVWLNGGGLARPKTFDGLLLCYNDAVPFFRASLVNTIIFAAIFFGSYYVITSRVNEAKQVA
ncbi:MAG TPA: DUF6580 family putative transport protein [Flavisolibacter sp.]|nr:DUF6580 family putative transport protein [Flavisolibacter sp.]